MILKKILFSFIVSLIRVYSMHKKLQSVHDFSTNDRYKHRSWTKFATYQTSQKKNIQRNKLNYPKCAYP